MSTRSRNSTARNSRAATPNALPISRSSKTKASAQDDHAPDWVEPISVHSDNETLLLLRANTEYAVVTQFLALFGADMNIHDYSTAILERDLDGTMPDSYCPKLTAKLVQLLTQDRTINRDHYMPRLRREFAKRSPEESELLGNDKLEPGEEGGPIIWESLQVLDKVHILHSLCQWFFLDADKFRNLVGEPEDEVEWVRLIFQIINAMFRSDKDEQRIEPVGYDASNNALWLFDDNRLWLQRIHSQPKHLTTALLPTKSRSKRRLSDLSEEAEILPSKKRKPLPVAIELGPKRNTRRSRNDNDGWQAVPEEWLKTSVEPVTKHRKAPAKSRTKVKKAKAKTQTEDGESSDLSELSASEAEKESDEDEEMEEPTVEEEEYIEEPLPKGFVEWETLCVTLEDWEEYIQKLSMSKSRNEKIFYKYVSADVLPAIREDIETQREESRKAIKKIEKVAATAIMERKRSSRIATQESVRDVITQREAIIARLASGNRRGAERSTRSGAASLAHLTEEERRELRMREREERKLNKQDSQALDAVLASTQDDVDQENIEQEDVEELLEEEETEAKADGEVEVEAVPENVSSIQDIPLETFDIPVQPVTDLPLPQIDNSSSLLPVEEAFEPIRNIALDALPEATVDISLEEGDIPVEEEQPLPDLSDPPTPEEVSEPEYQPEESEDDDYDPRASSKASKRPRKSAASKRSPPKAEAARPSVSRSNQSQSRSPRQASRPSPAPNAVQYARSPYAQQQVNPRMLPAGYGSPYQASPQTLQNPDYSRYMQQQQQMQRIAIAQGNPQGRAQAYPPQHVGLQGLPQHNHNTQYANHQATAQAAQRPMQIPTSSSYGGYTSPQAAYNGHPALQRTQGYSAADAQSSFMHPWQLQQHLQQQQYPAQPQQSQPYGYSAQQQQFPYPGNVSQQGSIPGVSSYDYSQTGQPSV